MFQAKAGSGNTASARSTRNATSDTVASYAISDEQGTKEKGSGQPTMNQELPATSDAGWPEKRVMTPGVNLVAIIAAASTRRVGPKGQ
jgi:hypothetical protein